MKASSDKIKCNFIILMLHLRAYNVVCVCVCLVDTPENYDDVVINGQCSQCATGESQITYFK